MKKIILSLAALASLSFSGNYGTAGCGLGALLFGDKPGGVQIFVATTNGTYGNQTFGITSGTLNCSDDGVAMNDREQEFFAEANFRSLSQEVAQGKGENLQAFAGLFGCGQNTEQFASTLKAQYNNVLPAESTPNTFVTNVRTVVNAELRESCAL